MAAQRKGPMAVNKSATPVWMKVVIILVAVSFVGGLVLAGIASTGSAPTAASGDDSVAAQRQATLDAALSAAEAQPENTEVVAALGHAYFDYAVMLYESQRQRESVPYWQNAVIQYDKVLAVTPDDDVLLGNKAFALYYAGSAGAPAALEAFIESAADNATLAAQVDTARQLLAELESQPVGGAEATLTP